MSEEEEKVRLRNCRQQPVEVHLPYTVIVLPPGGDAVVASSLLATPQLSWLLASGKLSTEPLATAGEPSEPADASGARGAVSDQEPDRPPDAGTPAAAKPKRDTTRRSGRAPKP